MVCIACTINNIYKTETETSKHFDIFCRKTFTTFNFLRYIVELDIYSRQLHTWVTSNF